MLSFRLVGLDLADEKPDLAFELMNFERRLQWNCRTIIDESDEVLDPKFQLIYTRGNQQNVDGESDRWETIQDLLAEVEKQAISFRLQDESSLGIEQNGIRYPIFHFLKADAPDLLLQRLINAVKNGALPGLSFNQWAPQIRESALRFITLVEITEDDEATVRGVCLRAAPS